MGNFLVGSYFRLQETETHFQAEYRRGVLSSRAGLQGQEVTRRYAKGSLEAQNIQIHGQNLLALDAIAKRFYSRELGWTVLGWSAIAAALLLLAVCIFDKSLGTATSNRMLEASGGLALVGVVSFVQYVRYYHKLHVAAGALSSLARDFEERLANYIEQKPLEAKFTYYPSYSESPSWLWDPREYLSEKEREEMRSAVTLLPDTLLSPPPSISLKNAEGVCALGGNSCVHTPECMRLQPAPI